MTAVYALMVLALVYPGVLVLSSRIRLGRKIALNLMLGLLSVHMFDRACRGSNMAIELNIFSLTVIALCGPAGLIPVLLVGMFS